MSSIIEKRQEELIELFSMYDDWMDKYQEIIDMAKVLEPLDEEYKQQENLIKGCQSRVWLGTEKQGDTVIFKADSDAIITKGLVAMMVQILSGAPAEEIITADLYFIDKIGLKEHLSPTRSNGLASMVVRMKKEALNVIAAG